MTYEIATSPLAWFSAALNFCALITALSGSAILAFKRKDRVWLPIFAAILLVYGLSYTARIRSGRIPAVPYAKIGSLETNSGRIWTVEVSYTFDLMAIGLACGAVIAVKRK